MANGHRRPSRFPTGRLPALLYGVEPSFVLVSAPPAAGWVVALPHR
jgi:hypothetical protein